MASVTKLQQHDAFLRRAGFGGVVMRPHGVVRVAFNAGTPGEACQVFAGAVDRVDHAAAVDAVVAAVALAHLERKEKKG